MHSTHVKLRYRMIDGRSVVEQTLVNPRSRAGISRLALIAVGGLALGLFAGADTASAQSTCSGTTQTGQTPNGTFDDYQTACGSYATTSRGSDNVAVGSGAFATDGTGHIAIGAGTSASGTSSGGLGAVINQLNLVATRANSAVGYRSRAGGDDSGNTVVGSFADGSGNGSVNVAIGTGAASYGSGSTNIAIGGARAIGDGTSKIAIGDYSVAGGNNSVAMGYNARANGNFSVAIGAGSTADGDFTFSVGSSTNRRRVANVANGVIVAGSADAVTGGQLYDTNLRVTALESGAANALGVAQTAQQSADAAQATANTALAEAFYAQNVAEFAQVTADTARAEAAAAQQTADTAIVRGDTLGGSVAAALGGGASYDAVNAIVTAPSYGVAGAVYNNAGDAFAAINQTGINHFRTDGSLGLAQATGAGSTAMGGESVASGARSTAAGAGAQATGASSVAMGDTARANAAGAVAVGLNSAATGLNAIAIGNGANATGSVAVGAGASAANGGAAFGDGSVATGVNATATGPNAQALADNSAAIGSGSIATQANTVSVGSAANQRRVTNVAAGTASTDAANVGQLGAAGSSVARALGGGATADATGVVSSPRYALYMGTFDNVGSALDALSTFATDARLEARRGIAAAMAMSSAPMPSAPGRTSWTVNAAEFNGEAALGGSIAHRFGSGERPLAVSAGFSHSGRESAFRVGMSGEF